MPITFGGNPTPSDVLRPITSITIPSHVFLQDFFISGGSSSGTLGDLGWNLAGTGAAAAAAGGSAGLMIAPAAGITSSLNTAVVFLPGNNYTGSSVINANPSIPTISQHTIVARNVRNFTNNSSFSFGFGRQGGSTASPNKVIDENSIGVAYVSPASATWTPNFGVAAGYSVVPTVSNGRKYICTTAGTTGPTEPTWPLNYGVTVTDGTVTWTNAGYSGNPNYICFTTGTDSISTANILVTNFVAPTAQTGQPITDFSVRIDALSAYFSINNSAEVALPRVSSVTTFTPCFAVRNDLGISPAGSAGISFRYFGYYAPRRATTDP